MVSRRLIRQSISSTTWPGLDLLTLKDRTWGRTWPSGWSCSGLEGKSKRSCDVWASPDKKLEKATTHLHVGKWFIHVLFSCCKTQNWRPATKSRVRKTHGPDWRPGWILRWAHFCGCKKVFCECCHVQELYSPSKMKNLWAVGRADDVGHSVVLTSSQASSSGTSSCFCASCFSSAGGLEYRQEVLPSFHVTTMSPAVNVLALLSNMGGLCCCSRGDVPLSWGGGGSRRSSPSLLLTSDAASLYLAIFFLLLQAIKQGAFRLAYGAFVCTVIVELHTCWPLLPFPAAETQRAGRRRPVPAAQTSKWWLQRGEHASESTVR